MTVSPYPDLTGAIRAYVRGLPAVVALVSDRVWIGWPRGPDGSLRLKVPPFLHAILIESGRGGLGPDTEAPYQTERVDISCLGPTEAEAVTVWRTLGPYLVSPDRRVACSFSAANTLVSLVSQEGGPIRLPDPDTRWPRVVVGYQFRYCAIPVSDLATARMGA